MRVCVLKSAEQARKIRLLRGGALNFHGSERVDMAGVDG
jgi:hypothetical protein